eukprot:1635415-Prymnesium_polylepis.3
MAVVTGGSTACRCRTPSRARAPPRSVTTASSAKTSRSSRARCPAHRCAGCTSPSTATTTASSASRRVRAPALPLASVRAPHPPRRRVSPHLANTDRRKGSPSVPRACAGCELMYTLR